MVADSGEAPARDGAAAERTRPATDRRGAGVSRRGRVGRASPLIRRRAALPPVYSEDEAARTREPSAGTSMLRSRDSRDNRTHAFVPIQRTGLGGSSAADATDARQGWVAAAPHGVPTAPLNSGATLLSHYQEYSKYCFLCFASEKMFVATRTAARPVMPISSGLAAGHCHRSRGIVLRGPHCGRQSSVPCIDSHAPSRSLATSPLPAQCGTGEFAPCQPKPPHTEVACDGQRLARNAFSANLSCMARQRLRQSRTRHCQRKDSTGSASEPFRRSQTNRSVELR